MRIAHPWECDVCGRAKGPSNHWWIGYFHSFPAKGVVIQRWSDALAAAPDYFHLCGLECVTRWVTRFLPQCDEPTKGDL